MCRWGTAFEEAYRAKRGFFDPEVECTLASVIDSANVQEQKATALKLGTTAAAAATTLATLKGMEKSAKAIRSELDAFEQSSSLAVQAYVAIGRSTVIVDANRRLDAVTNLRSDAAAAVKQRKANEVDAAATRAHEAAAAEKTAAERRKASNDSDSPEEGSYPGYTGPRCYAPGGKTWKPC